MEKGGDGCERREKEEEARERELPRRDWGSLTAGRKGKRECQ
jgi:hypothetical protein